MWTDVPTGCYLPICSKQQMWIFLAGGKSSPSRSLHSSTFLHFVFPSSHISLFPPAVPAQPSDFDGEAELDSRIMLSWLWPVQEPIISFELVYWEANNPTDKVNTALKIFSFHWDVACKIFIGYELCCASGCVICINVFLVSSKCLHFIQVW